MRPTDRPQGANSLFFGRAYENSRSCHILRDKLRNERSPHADDSPRIGIICPVFSSQNRLRAERNPNTCYNTRLKASSSSKNALVTSNVCCQIRITPLPQPYRRNTYTVLAYFMVRLTLSHSRVRHSIWSYLLPHDISTFTTRDTFCKDCKSFFLLLTGAFASRTSYSTLSTYNDKPSLSINYLIKVV